MSASVAFVKMHGCGNDYVFLDCFSQPAPADPAAFARHVSDRHRSIGSDGLVLMLPGDEPGAAGRMRMFNADGSEGAVCGNALRCFAMWLHQAQRAPTSFVLAMAQRRIPVTIVTSDPYRRQACVRLAMGAPEIRVPGSVAFSDCVHSVLLPGISITGLLSPGTHVSMGNPHTVFFVNRLDELPFAVLGPAVECHPQFPQRTNVEFAEISGPAEVRVRVWERGSGETLACGSGACAVVVAGMASGLIAPYQTTTVRMAGGDLRVSIDKTLQVFLEGPAEECCRGTVLWPLQAADTAVCGDSVTHGEVSA
jgi:diaminopimelate epimerase